MEKVFSFIEDKANKVLRFVVNIGILMLIMALIFTLIMMFIFMLRFV